MPLKPCNSDNASPPRLDLPFIWTMCTPRRAHGAGWWNRTPRQAWTQALAQPAGSGVAGANMGLW